MRDADVTRIFIEPARNGTIDEVNLSNRELTYAQVNRIMRAAQESPSVRRIIIGDTQITEATFNKIKNALNNNPNIIAFDIRIKATFHKPPFNVNYLSLTQIAANNAMGAAVLAAQPDPAPQIDQLRAERDDAIQEINRLRDEHGQQMHDLQERLEELRIAFQDLEADRNRFLDENRHQVDGLRAELRDAQAAQQHLGDENHALRVEHGRQMHDLQGRLEELRTAFQALEADRNRLFEENRRQGDDHRHQVDGLRAELRDAQAAQQHLGDENLALRDEHGRQMSSLKDQLTALRQAFEALRADRDLKVIENTRLVTIHRRELEGLRRELEAARHELSNKQDQHLDADGRLQTVTRERDALNNRVAQLNDELREQNLKIQQFERTLIERNEEIIQLEAQLADERQRVNDASQAASTLGKEHQMAKRLLEQQVRDAQASVHQKEVLIDALRADVAKEREANQASVKSKDVLERELSDLSSKLQAQVSRVRELEQAQHQSGKSITELEARNLELEGQLRGADNALREAIADASKHESKVGSTEAFYQREINKLQAKIQENETEIGRLEREVMAQRSEREGLQGEVASAKERIKAIQEQSRKLNAEDAQAHREQIRTLDDQIKQIEEEARRSKEAEDTIDQKLRETEVELEKVRQSEALSSKNLGSLQAALTQEKDKHADLLRTHEDVARKNQVLHEANEHLRHENARLGKQKESSGQSSALIDAQREITELKGILRRQEQVHQAELAQVHQQYRSGAAPSHTTSSESSFLKRPGASISHLHQWPADLTIFDQRGITDPFIRELKKAYQEPEKYLKLIMEGMSRVDNTDILTPNQLLQLAALNLKVIELARLTHNEALVSQAEEGLKQLVTTLLIRNVAIKDGMPWDEIRESDAYDEVLKDIHAQERLLPIVEMTQPEIAAAQSHSQAFIDEAKKQDTITPKGLTGPVASTFQYGEYLGHTVAYCVHEEDCPHRDDKGLLPIKDTDGVTRHYHFQHLQTTHDGLEVQVLYPENYDVNADIKVLFTGSHTAACWHRNMCERGGAGNQTLLRDAASLLTQLNDIMAKFKEDHPDTPLNLTIAGHSLGGADTQNFTVILLRKLAELSLLQKDDREKLNQFKGSFPHYQKSVELSLLSALKFRQLRVFTQNAAGVPANQNALFQQSIEHLKAADATFKVELFPLKLAGDIVQTTGFEQLGCGIRPEIAQVFLLKIPDEVEGLGKVSRLGQFFSTQHPHLRKIFDKSDESPAGYVFATNLTQEGLEYIQYSLGRQSVVLTSAGILQDLTRLTARTSHPNDDILSSFVMMEPPSAADYSQENDGETVSPRPGSSPGGENKD